MSDSIIAIDNSVFMPFYPGALGWEWFGYTEKPTMSVELLSSDETTIVATVDVPAFPNNPDTIVYGSRAFRAATGYGPDALQYQEVTVLFLS